jgi:hypothetical protein
MNAKILLYTCESNEKQKIVFSGDRVNNAGEIYLLIRDMRCKLGIPNKVYYFVYIKIYR